MNIPKTVKNTALATLIWLWAIGSSKKLKDYYSDDHYKNLKTHFLQWENPINNNQNTDYILWDDVSLVFTDTDTKNSIKEYKKHSFPDINYATDPQLYQQLIQDRIDHQPYPGVVFPTSLEEYDSDIIKKHWNALCSSAIWMKLSKMNHLDKSMQEFFWKQWKHTRYAEQLLSQYGWESSIETKDKLSYYDKTNHNHLHPHYNQLLINLHHAQAWDIFLMRYDKSGAHAEATEANKNATHNIISRGQQKQILTWKQIGLEKNSQNFNYFLKLSPEDQKAELIYLLMNIHTQAKDSKGNTVTISRTPNPKMIGDKTSQKERIKMLLTTYPDLITIQRKQHQSDITVTYQGIMWEHVYPVAGKPTNFANFLFELIAYTGSNNDGSSLLLCDHLTPWKKIKKNLEQYSPIYTKIKNIREEISKKDMILKTYIVSFDMIDINKNKKIDRGDKTIDEILDEMTEISYHDTYSINQLEKPKIKEYIRKYLHMIGAMDRFPTWTLLYIPYLTEANMKIIDSYYTQYEDYYFQRQKASQDHYEKHISESLYKYSIDKIPNNGIIMYPTIPWDDELSITRQICNYIDIIIQNSDNKEKSIRLNNLTNEELQTVFSQIQSHIKFPSSYPHQSLQSWQKITINLKGCLQAISKNYYPRKVELWQNHLPEISINKNIDKLYNILEISPSVQQIQNHIIVRETWWEISRFDIAKWRSWTKMLAEQIDLDDNNPLKSIKSINSEWPLQIRIDYFLWANNNIDLLIQSTQKILEKKWPLWLTHNQISTLENIITLSNDLKKHNSTTQSTEFEAKRNHLKHILSDIINLTPHSLNSPEQDLWSLLSIALTALSTEKYMWRYSTMIESSLDKWESLSSEEISFLQHFVIIAHHLWQQDADRAFKIYMSIHMMRTYKELHYITKAENKQFTELSTQLNQLRKTDQWYNTKRYEDRHNTITSQWKDNSNPYINSIKEYLDPKSTNQNIPYYNSIRKLQFGDHTWIINNNLFEANANQEFSLYLTTLPPHRDGTSAMIRIMFTIMMIDLWILTIIKDKQNQ